MSDTPIPTSDTPQNMRTARAEDGLTKIEAIADAFVRDPGCEMNVVEKIEEMGHMIQRLRSDLHEIDRMLTEARHPNEKRPTE